MSVFGLGLTSWVGPGKRVTPRVCVRLSLSLSLSLCLSLSPSPGFPLVDFNLDGKTDAAACSDTIAHSSEFCRYPVWVSRRGSVRGKGPPRGCVCVSLSLSLRGSTGLGHRQWVYYVGSEGGTGNTYFSGVNSLMLGDHLTSWDRSPKVLVDRRSYRVSTTARWTRRRGVFREQATDITIYLLELPAENVCWNCHIIYRFGLLEQRFWIT